MSDHTAAEIVALLGQSYTPAGVAHVLEARILSLGGRTPMELMQTAQGRERVYDWALGLAEGVMG